MCRTGYKHLPATFLIYAFPSKLRDLNAHDEDADTKVLCFILEEKKSTNHSAALCCEASLARFSQGNLWLFPETLLLQSIFLMAFLASQNFEGALRDLCLHVKFLIARGTRPARVADAHRCGSRMRARARGPRWWCGGGGGVDHGITGGAAAAVAAAQLGRTGITIGNAPLQQWPHRCLQKRRDGPGCQCPPCTHTHTHTCGKVQGVVPVVPVRISKGQQALL